MEGSKKITYFWGIVFWAVCLLVLGADIREVHAEGEIKVIREAKGDLEQLEAICVSEDILSEWRLEESTQNSAGAADDGVQEFLSYSSDYGYRDMAKRSNVAARQDAYRQLETICRNFSTNGKDAEIRTSDGKEYAAAGVVELPEYSMTWDELAEIYFMFRNDNPQYFWLSNQVLYSMKSSGVGASIIPLTYDAYRSGAERSSTLEEIVETAQTVYQQKITSADDGYHKVLKLHDTLIADIEYSKDTSIPTSHSIAGAMTSARSAVCEGYAKVMQLMMNCYCIENIYITGDAGGGHAWNMVCMNDGNYYWLDATWDDQPYEEYQHQYFLVGNQNFTDHTADAATGSGKYFLYELPLASDEDYVYSPDVPVPSKGDINGDGRVTMTDLLMCLHHVSGRSLLAGDAFLMADINGDGAVKMTDLLRILHYVSGRNPAL